MRRLLIHTLLFAVLATAATAAVIDDPSAIRDVQAAFERAVAQYRYGQAWTLWESGDRRSREHLTQAEFQQLMDTRSAQLAGGHPVEINEIRISSPTVAVVRARCTLTSRRTPYQFTTEYIFSFLYEDGDWRPVLANFLGLAAH